MRAHELDESQRRAKEKTPRMEAMRASILHLIDLKRAGHSPTKTEYYIPHDCTVSSLHHPKPEPSLSPCSNSLAWVR